MEFYGENLSKDGENIKDCMTILYKFLKLVFRVSEMRELNFGKKIIPQNVKNFRNGLGIAY